MKTFPASPTPLNVLHADVTTMVRAAQNSGPVLLIDDSGAPAGVVLGFDDAEDAADWMTLNSPEGRASIARGKADAAAGRVSSLDEVERSILG